MMAIGPVDRWIAEGREEELLPVAGASDRDALQKLFELGCHYNWEPAVRRCVTAQPTWSAVEHECATGRVLWHDPSV